MRKFNANEIDSMTNGDLIGYGQFFAQYLDVMAKLNADASHPVMVRVSSDLLTVASELDRREN